MFMMLIMELCLLANAKQLANYAAFCAARTASVYGVDSTAKTHFAAAMAMSSISPGDPAECLGDSAARTAWRTRTRPCRPFAASPVSRDSSQWLCASGRCLRQNVPADVRHRHGYGQDPQVRQS